VHSDNVVELVYFLKHTNVEIYINFIVFQYFYIDFK